VSDSIHFHHSRALPSLVLTRRRGFAAVPAGGPPQRRTSRPLGTPVPRSGPWRTAKVRRLLDIGQRTA
jgi:hypothetical protein